MARNFTNQRIESLGGLWIALKKLNLYLKSKRLMILLVLILAGASSVSAVAGPKLIGRITDVMSAGLGGQIDMAAVARIGLVLLAVFLLASSLAFLQNFLMAKITLGMAKRFRNDISHKINRVPIAHFHSVPQGDILSRITNDVSTLQQALSNSLPGIITALAQFFGVLIMMLLTDLRLAFTVMGVTLLGLVGVTLSMVHSQKFFSKRQKNLGALNGYVEEMYSGHSVIRLSLAGESTKEAFRGYNFDVYDANWKSQFFSGIMQPLMSVVGNISYVAVCVLGSYLAVNGKISFGVIVTFIMYSRQFANPLSQLAQRTTQMQMAGASANRIFEFLEAEEMPDESHKRGAAEPVRGEVLFENVKFAYPENPDTLIIKDFTAHVKPGQKVAIVGPTGAGKTTLVNLLMRFYEVNSGRIVIDGVPTAEMNRADLHELFGMVLQDTWLFEGSVRENLVYNMKEVSDEELRRVCRACGIDDFIDALPEGFDTVLSEQTQVSAGQKQLFTIARAMLQNSPMLILDEATSSVDTRTEAIIQKAMDDLTQGRTSFVIAHRLSTIRNADLILVMQDGDVIEKGTHEELVAQRGFYAELYNSQFDEAA